VTLDVVGDGGGAAGERLPGLRYHGVVPTQEELARRYAACDLFVSPATGAESFGLVVAEAMACARPVVCSDIEGYRHVAGGGDQGASLVAPRDPAALAAAIEGLASDPARRRKMGEAGRRRALAFDWSTIAPVVRTEYLAAIAARHGMAAARAHETTESPVSVRR
jgi:phosphatidylinositol alpha-mannosyltransferase